MNAEQVCELGWLRTSSSFVWRRVRIDFWTERNRSAALILKMSVHVRPKREIPGPERFLETRHRTKEWWLRLLSI